MKKQVLLFVLILMPLMASAQTKINGIYYNLNSTDKVAEVTSDPYGTSKYAGSITIPNTIAYGGVTYSVTSIGESAFLGCSGLTSITIPGCVISIGYEAFLGCSRLTSITIPNSVTSIGSYSFSGCTSLPVINNCRYADTYLVEVVDKTIATCSIKEGTRFIGDYAFSGCSSLTSVTIPNSVTTISRIAFSGCSSLTSVTIPNSVTFVESSAFYGCSGLTSITIPNSVTTIGSSAFSGCSSLTSIDIPNSVTTIESCAFSGCSSLTSIDIPNSVTTIGSSAFSGCSSLTSIDIPNSVTTIGSSAFEGCSSLTSIDIPSSVTTIGLSIFYGCTGLTSITVENGNPVYDSRNNCNAIVETSTNELVAGCKSTIIPNTVTIIESYAFSGCFGLTSITIPNSVTTIGSGAFEGCSGLVSIDIPNSVTTISWGAFKGCLGLTSIDIPNSVTTIESGVFEGCLGLTSIDIPNSVTTIESGVFEGCSGLTSIDIPNSVTTIEDYSFSGCSSLTSIDIPNSVSSIGECVFSDCLNLSSITVENGNSVYDSRNNCNAIVVTSRNEIIAGCKSTIIPNSVTRIGNGAFYKCTSLTSIVIPDGVDIGVAAFRGCSNLETVSIPSSVTYLEGGRNLSDLWLTSFDDNMGVFSECNNLKIIILNSPNPPDFVSINPYVDAGPTFSNSLASIYVPLGSMNAYLKSEWSSFKRIIEFRDNEDLKNIFNNLRNTLDLPFIYPMIYNEQIDISIDLLNESNIQSMEFDIYLPDGLSFVTDDHGNAQVSWKENRKPIGEFKDNSYTFSDKHIRISGMGYGSSYIGNEGEIVKVRIKADKDLIAWELYPIVIKDIKLKDDDKEYKTDSICSFIRWENFGDYHLVEKDGIGYNLYTDGRAVVANAIKTFTVSNIDDAPYERYGIHEGWVDISDDNSVASTSIVDTLFVYSGDIVIPQSVEYRGHTYTVTGINPHAFRGSKNMTSVTLPSTLTTVGNNAFYDCKGLETVIIPEGVTDIGNYAFYNATMMKAVTIPSTISTIGGYAFHGCNKLTSVTIYQKTPIAIGSSRFSNRANAILFVPRGSKALYEAANYWNEFKEIKEVDIDNPILIDGIYYALYEDTEMAVVVKGDSEYTGDIIIPEYINYQGKKYKVNTIAIKAFQDCSELTSVSIPTTVDLIDDHAFEGCNSLTTVNIPASVTLLGGYAFSGCDNLTSVKVNWTDPLVIGRSRFSNRANAILCVPIGSKSAYQKADYWKEFKAIVESGDVNGDGMISVTDVVNIINYILGNQNADFIDIAADTNGDGIVNISDVVNLVNAILEQ